MPTGIRAIILTLLLAGGAYFAGNARMQLWDRDEPRYAECSRQMLESGNWVVPRLYDKLRFQKPPLIYWCQASAMKLFGSQGDAGAMAARFPSVIAMLATLVLLSIILARHVGIEQSAWTVFIFASSAMAIVAAKTCLTDGVLLLFIVIAQLCFYSMWRGNWSWKIVVAMSVALGIGLLAKGPFILGIMGTTAAVLGAFRLVEKYSSPLNVLASDVPAMRSKSEQTIALQITVGLFIIAAIVTPWIIFVSHRAPDFLPAMFHEGRQHALEGKEGHHFPPGYHLVLVWPMFMPWSLLLPLGIGVGIANRRNPAIRFALAAVIGPWLMVEFMGTKLPHYFLPAYPAMAFLVAFALRRCINGTSRDLQSRSFFIATIVWAIAVVGISAAPWIAVRTFRPLPLGAMVAFSTLGMLLACGTFLLFCMKRPAHACIVMGVGMLVFITTATTFYFPAAQFLCISRDTAATLKAKGATHLGDVKMVDYKEPSLAFYQGGTIREVEKKADLIYKPLDQWPHWVVITRDAWDMVPAETRKRLRIVETRRGWAYADQGRVVEVMIVENPVY